MTRLLVLCSDLLILGYVDVVVHGPGDGDGQHDALKQDVKQELESLHRQLLTEGGDPAPLALCEFLSQLRDHARKGILRRNRSLITNWLIIIVLHSTDETNASPNYMYLDVHLWKPQVCSPTNIIYDRLLIVQYT